MKCSEAGTRCCEFKAPRKRLINPHILYSDQEGPGFKLDVATGCVAATVIFIEYHHKAEKHHCAHQ